MKLFPTTTTSTTTTLVVLTLFGSTLFASTAAFQVKSTPKSFSPPTAVALPTPQEAISIVADDVEHSWIRQLDYNAFRQEVSDLGKQLIQEGGEDDVQHLHKMIRWRNVAAVVGIGTMWMPVNPVTVLALSTWTYSSWVMIAHHTCHGGYNRYNTDRNRNADSSTSATTSSFHSKSFAVGTLYQRIQDWCDWILPEAWNYEHNRLHHYYLGESSDPDLVERNLHQIRTDPSKPMWYKYLYVLSVMPVWKWLYYAPNTYKELVFSSSKQDFPPELDPTQAATIPGLLFPSTPSEHALKQVLPWQDILTQVLGPMLLTRFLLLPAPLLLLPAAWHPTTLFTNALVQLVLADLLTNIHSFMTIVTNHCGNDLYKFDTSVKPRSGSFYVRQIVGSVNYNLGNDVIDFSHGFLNYQIEHHVWPDLSMLQYQKGAPLLQAICAKHNVPYLQESAWTRTWKTIAVMVGRHDMKVFPTHLEPIQDRVESSTSTSAL